MCPAARRAVAAARELTAAFASAVSVRWRGVALALLVAACATFLSEHYGAPVMLFALLIGLAFHFLAEDRRLEPGISFASKGLLQAGVALLALRMSAGDLAAMGWRPVAAIVVLVGLTIGFGISVAPLLGRRWRFGLLTGGAVAICGASAALAIASVLPKRDELERDTVFTVVAVTALSTLAMILYPILFAYLGMGEAKIGFLIGATIHDVAQVAGAGYSVSEAAGDVAILAKLERVALLPVVLIFVILFGRGAGAGDVRLPWFIVAFAVLLAVNSFGVVPGILQDLAAQVSRWLLVTAIAALGLKTSLAALFELGLRHLGVIAAETGFLLVAAVVVAGVWLA